MEFTHLAALISKGCERTVQAWATHADELDEAGADVLNPFIAVSTREACRSPSSVTFRDVFRDLLAVPPNFARRQKEEAISLLQLPHRPKRNLLLSNHRVQLLEASQEGSGSPSFLLNHALLSEKSLHRMRGPSLSQVSGAPLHPYLVTSAMNRSMNSEGTLWTVTVEIECAT